MDNFHIKITLNKRDVFAYNKISSKHLKLFAFTVFDCFLYEGYAFKRGSKRITTMRFIGIYTYPAEMAAFQRQTTGKIQLIGRNFG